MLTKCGDEKQMLYAVSIIICLQLAMSQGDWLQTSSFQSYDKDRHKSREKNYLILSNILRLLILPFKWKRSSSVKSDVVTLNVITCPCDTDSLHCFLYFLSFFFFFFRLHDSERTTEPWGNLKLSRWRGWMTHTYSHEEKHLGKELPSGYPS